MIFNPSEIPTIEEIAKVTGWIIKVRDILSITSDENEHDVFLKKILENTQSLEWRTDAPPKDGTYFLAAVEGWGVTEDGILYRLMCKCTDGISKRFNDDSMHFSCKEEEISAWRPIPKWIKKEEEEDEV